MLLTQVRCALSECLGPLSKLVMAWIAYKLTQLYISYNNMLRLCHEMFTTSLVAAVHKVKGHYERK